MRFPASGPDVAGGARSRRVATIALGVAGLGVALVLLDGSRWWAVVRLLAVGALVARGMAVLRRGNAGRAAVAALVLGASSTSIGGAIAFSWWSVTGIGIRSLGGLLALAAGVVLVGGGVALGRLAVHGWARLAGAVGIVVLAYTLCLPVVVSVAATNVPRRGLGSAAADDLGLGARAVSFPASDGVRLSGWYLPSRNRAAVVVLHGASSNRISVLPQARVLARHGYGVLVFDARGTGRSGGRAMNLGWWGDQDVAGAVAFVADRPDVDPARIGALGESMGGEEAIGALPAVPGLRAVVAEGATGRTAGDHDWLSERYGARGLFQEGVDRLTYGLTDLLTDASSPRTLRRAIRDGDGRPVLLVVAGSVDEERYAAADLRAASPGTVRVWVVDRAAHTGGLRTDPRGWERTVVGFLDGALLAGD